MAYYILKAHWGGPPFYKEYCYDETVDVNNGIIVTQKLASSEELQQKEQFSLLATYETPEEVEKFLHPKLPVSIEAANPEWVSPIQQMIEEVESPQMKVKRGRPSKEIMEVSKSSVPWFDGKENLMPRAG